MKYSSVRT